MLYVEYIADVQLDKMTEYHEIMTEFRRLAEKHGVKFIGAWTTVHGKEGEVSILESYENLGDFDRIRTNITSDPDLRELIAKMAKIRAVRCRFLQPTSYSPLV